MSARHRKCPTPDKQKYSTYAEAVAALRQPYRSTLKAPVRAYRCRGHYHVTSRTRD